MNIIVKYEDDTVTLPGKIGDSVLDVIVDNEYEILGYGEYLVSQVKFYLL